MEARAIAIIPARGGSRRIPRKNIRDFAGRPIISYTIEAALKSGCFDEVMVSTDDQQIAHVAVAEGALVPFFRSEDTACDTAGMVEVVLEVLNAYASSGKHFPIFCCLLATAPFVTADLLLRGRALLNKNGASGVTTVCKFSYPIQRALKIGDTGSLEMFWPENYPRRSQDLEPAYHDAGLFYWGKSECLSQTRRMFDESSLPLIVSESECQDIDTEEDWQAAELKYKLLKGV